MSHFTIAVLVGLLLYQIASAFRPLSRSRGYHFGRDVTVRLSERAYVTAISVAVLAFIVLVTIIIVQRYHPPEGYPYRFVDVLRSPEMGTALFGGLVGVLLGNLLNRVLRNRDYEFTSRDHWEIVTIFLLVILGIGGDEFIRSYARRINKISLGTTTEISFSEIRPKNTRAAAEQPRGAALIVGPDGAEGSAGLLASSWRIKIQSR